MIQKKTPKGTLDTDKEESGRHRDAERQPLKKHPGGVNPETGERGGPAGPEPTRFGDWERKGRVRKVESDDEIQFHRLEAKTARLFYEKDMMTKIQEEAAGSGIVTPFAPASAHAGTSGAAPMTPGVSRIAAGGYGTGAARPGAPSRGPLMIGGAPAHPKVESLGMQGVKAECLEILVRHSNEKPDEQQGMHLSEIRNHPLVRGRGPQEITEALNMLTQEGHVYTTTTEEWFKVITD